MSEITRRPYNVSTPDEGLDVLRARFNEDGYLFLKRAVSTDLCRALLGTILQQLKPHIEV